MRATLAPWFVKCRAAAEPINPRPITINSTVDIELNYSALPTRFVDIIGIMITGGKWCLGPESNRHGREAAGF